MRILCFGDSNTYGYDPRGFFGGRYDADDRWTDRLARQTGAACVNLGANGREIPRDSRGPEECTSADVLLVMLGTNDLLQGADAAEAAARMEAFLNHALPHCARILLIAPPPMKRGAWVPTDALVRESIRLVEEYGLLAQKLGISFADTRNWGIALAFDGVHFTEAGHHTFADRLSRLIAEKFA